PAALRRPDAPGRIAPAPTSPAGAGRPVASAQPRRPHRSARRRSGRLPGPRGPPGPGGARRRYAPLLPTSAGGRGAPLSAARRPAAAASLATPSVSGRGPVRRQQRLFQPGGVLGLAQVQLARSGSDRLAAGVVGADGGVAGFAQVFL